MRTTLALLIAFGSARADIITIRIPTTTHQVGNVSWCLPARKGPKVALVLSGGGARGFAHLGVLKAWEQTGLPLDYLVGTSIGGTLGGLYASGYSADSLAQLARSTDWNELLSNRPPRRNLFLSRRHEKDEALIELRFDHWKPRIPTAITSGQKLSHFLADLTRAADYQIDGDFDRLPIPLRVVATDFATGERVVLKGGNLGDALRSTVAVPLAFTPWELDGRLLADGGLVDPIPVDVAKELGADIVVAVNTTSGLLPQDRLSDPFTLANQATTIMVLQRLTEQLKLADYVITPALDSVENSDFSEIESTIAHGYEAAWPVLQGVRDRLLAERSDTTNDSGWIVKGSDPYSCEWVPVGSRVNRAQLKLVLEDQLKLGDFRELHVDVEAQADSAVLHWRGDHLPWVMSVEVIGNTLIPDSDCARIVSLLGGTSLRGSDLEAVTDSLEWRYRKAGYPLVSADSVRMDDSGNLQIQIQENPVATVKLQGQKRTRTRFIMNYLPEMENKPLSSRALSKGVNGLYATGLFKSVAAQTNKDSLGPEVRLKVEEQDFTRLRFGAHWHEEFRAEVFSELADVNVFGMGHQAALFGMYGDRRQQLEASLGADRLASTYLAYSLKAYYRGEKWRLFVLGNELPQTLEFERLGARLAIGQQIKRFGLLSVGMRIEDINDRVEPNLKSTDWNLRTVFVQAELDTYDRYPLPRSGYRQRIVLERAMEVFGGNAEFTKFWFELEGVLPLGREHAAIVGGAAGTSDTWLIEPERFILGGRSTMMGLHVGEGRGDYFWRGHVALRLHNGGSRFITLQYNLGNIWNHDAVVDLSDAIHGVGMAYTIDSPVGPLDFGIGLATDRSLVGYMNLGLPF